MVQNESSFKSVADIVKAAKAAPGKMVYGSAHRRHPSFERCSLRTFRRCRNDACPYKSGAAASTDLMGGHFAFMFEQMYAAMPSIKGGRLRALAITSKARSPLAPDIPTMRKRAIPQWKC